MLIFCDGMKHPTRCWWRVLLSNLCIWSFDQTEGILNPSNFGNQLYEEPGSKYNKELLRIPWVIPCTRRKELGKSTNLGNHCLFVLAYCCLKSVGFPMLLIDLCKTHTMEWYSKLGGCSKFGSRVILAQLLAFQEQAQHETMKPKWKRSTLTTSCWTRHSEIVQYLQSWLFSFRWPWSPGWVRSCFPFSLIPMCWQVKMKKQADAQLSNDRINQSPSRQSPSPEKNQSIYLSFQTWPSWPWPFDVACGVAGQRCFRWPFSDWPCSSSRYAASRPWSSPAAMETHRETVPVEQRYVARRSTLGISLAKKRRNWTPGSAWNNLKSICQNSEIATG